MPRQSPFLRTLPIFVVLACLGGCRNGNAGAAIESCTPGETLVVGCADSCGIGHCEGDPAIRICDGSIGINSCRTLSDSSMFVEVDDTSCGLYCPRTRITCPLSGSIAIITHGFGSSRYVCDWDVEHRGILPPGGRAAETVTCTAGASYVVGCALGCGLGDCEGSPALNACDGTASIDDCRSGIASSLSRSSTGSGCNQGCPYYVLRCPDSGTMTIVPTATGSDVCEWQIREVPNRAPGTEVCSAGQRVVVGCAEDCGLGTCEGSPGLRICDGNRTPDECAAFTTESSWLAQSFDTLCGSSDCAEVAATCPGSGAITVVPMASWSSDVFACNWSVRPAHLGE